MFSTSVKIGVRSCVRLLSSEAGRSVVSVQGRVRTTDALRLVDAGIIGQKAVAKVPLQAGTVINVFAEPVKSSPTMHTVQFDDRTHVAPTDGAEFISHGCFGTTNTRIIVDEDCASASFVVTRDVEAGGDLSFNYNTTEWHMNSPFVCQCASCQAGHTRKVQGHKHLSLEERSNIAHETSPHIRQLSAMEAAAHLKMLASLEENAETYFSALGEAEAEDEDVDAVASAGAGAN